MSFIFTGAITIYTYNELDQLLTAGSTQYQYGYDVQDRLASVSLHQ